MRSSLIVLFFGILTSCPSFGTSLGPELRLREPRIENCRERLAWWSPASSWGNTFTEIIAPFIKSEIQLENANAANLTIDEKISLIEAAHRRYIDSHYSDLPHELKTEYLAAHNEIPNWIRILLVKEVFPDTPQKDLYKMAGLTTLWEYKLDDSIPYINRVAQEKNPDHRALTIFEKIAIIDLGHRHYVREYASTLSGEVKTDYLRSYDKPLTIYTQIQLIKKVFPQTSQEDMDQLQKAAVSRTHEFIKNLDI